MLASAIPLLITLSDQHLLFCIVISLMVLVLVLGVDSCDSHVKSTISQQTDSKTTILRQMMSKLLFKK